MEEVEIKTFNFEEGYLNLYSDMEGKELEAKIPEWQFRQMVEKYLGIDIR